MKEGRTISLLCITLGSCIDPFPIPLGDTPEQLVVEGMITDQPGPYTVRLSMARTINDQLGNTQDVANATVVIEDSDGNSERLKESAPGNYVTVGMQGVIGKTYVLKITTAESAKYESEPEKLVAVGDIRRLYSVFNLEESPTKKYDLSTPNGFQIYVDAEVLPEQGGRVRWRTTRTFEILTYPALRMKYVAAGGGGVNLVPDPPGCSTNCYCCECWVTEYSSIPILSTPSLTGGNSLTKFPIDFIKASRRIFNQKCHIQVEQMSISENVYNFWEKISKQKRAGSDLFQTPLPNTKGNIKALSANAIPALGIFCASAIKVETMSIYRYEIPYSIPAMDTIKDSCLGVYKISTTSQPSFW